ncbi:MAG: MmcQ/YjbR family DNA-binding protein [Clostridiales bacterium]|nr:MmcQ/YjbR family DNA-binding protein [Clostridiales bacterium]
MTRQELVAFCLTFPDAYEDYPFAEMTGDDSWTAMRHNANKKTFAFINVLQDRLAVNLKCDPFEADFLRQAFRDVIAGYHMNKTHWNTVYIGGDVPEDVLKQMIAGSYALIKPKGKKKND